MYLLIIFLPLIGSLISNLFANYISKKGVIIINLFCITITAFTSFFIFYEVILCHSITSIKLFPWIESNIFLIYWGFLFDNLTAVMLVVVTFVSCLVHFYSVSYMSEDPHLCRFMSYLSLFTFFMLMLITADNFIQMFLGWEGVGLASYLLINFWHTRIEANKSAMKAIIINRIGDLGLSLGIAACFFIFNSLDFPIIFSLAPYLAQENIYFFNFEINKITLISLLLFVGAVGKSAQIGLHTWLPDAMEGPTPVSALIHAATMVTAGVFVLLRCSPLIEYSENSLAIITIIGVLTAFMAATIGLVQNDLKKVIAYSTCSQLGYMVFSIGLSNYSVSLFHLMNHAFFKALLFLSAGSVIHALSNEQDMRKMGGLLKLIPVTYIMIFIGSLSLMGFPFLTGFYSKDAILELTYGNYQANSFFTYWLGTISAFLTSFYSIRLLYLTFLNKNNSQISTINSIHESSWLILFPLLILCIGSIFFGFLAKELFLGANIDTWNNIFLVLPWHNYNFDSEFLPFYIKLIPVLFSLTGGLFSYFFYEIFQKYIDINLLYLKNYNIYHFLSKKWYFDDFYNKIISYFILNFSYQISFKLIDRGLLEWVGPFGIVQSMKKITHVVSKLQTGLIYHYIFSIILGIIFIIFLYLLPIYFTIIMFIIYFYLFICINLK